MFLNLSGSSRIQSGGNGVKLNEDFFFLTNRDQAYTLEIDAEKPVETFNLHFGDHFAEHALHSIAHSPAQLLDAPFDPEGQRAQFYNRSYPRDKAFNRLIRALQSTDSDEPNAELRREELMYDLFLHLFQLTREDQQRFEKLPVVRSTTRQEITKRLLLAVDYLHSFFDLNVSLDELARVSCLSKFHFLRLFKEAFGQTPYQYLKAIRIGRAKRLLTQTSLPVYQIAMEVGFENANSLSRAMVQATGQAPLLIRNASN